MGIANAIHFYNGKILRNHRIEDGELWINEGKIIPAQSEAAHVVDLKGNLLAPGYIDLQINGMFGCDITSNPEKVGDIAMRMGRYGVTSFLATVISANLEEYQRNLPVLQKQIGKTKGAELLGIHLEGPCFSPSQAKAHSAGKVRSCEEFVTPADCYGDMQGVKLVTLAPELPHALEWIKWLKKRGIVAAAGHTMASAQQLERAIEAGVSMVTHLFNAMATFHHRAPGIIGVVLNRPGFPYSIIVDGEHVDPLAVSLAWRCQPEGLFLVSDAMAALGAPCGGCYLADQQVDTSGGRALIAGTKMLAGSVVGIDQMVRNLRMYTRASVVEVLEAAALKPARVLGMEGRKGTLQIGADADLIILDSDLNLQACYARGVSVSIAD